MHLPQERKLQLQEAAAWFVTLLPRLDRTTPQSDIRAQAFGVYVNSFRCQKSAQTTSTGKLRPEFLYRSRRANPGEPVFTLLPADKLKVKQQVIVLTEADTAVNSFC